MRVDGKKIWFSATELVFEGGAQYRELTDDEWQYLRYHLGQSFCQHTTRFSMGDAGVKWFCNDCGAEWEEEVKPTADGLNRPHPANDGEFF